MGPGSGPGLGWGLGSTPACHTSALGSKASVMLVRKGYRYREIRAGRPVWTGEPYWSSIGRWLLWANEHDSPEVTLLRLPGPH